MSIYLVDHDMMFVDFERDRNEMISKMEALFRNSPNCFPGRAHSHDRDDPFEDFHEPLHDAGIIVEPVVGKPAHPSMQQRLVVKKIDNETSGVCRESIESVLSELLPFIEDYSYIDVVVTDDGCDIQFVRWDMGYTGPTGRELAVMSCDIKFIPPRDPMYSIPRRTP